MSNPDNSCTFRGILTENPSVCYTKDSKDICYIDFRIKIARSYLNKGEQKYDYPLLRYSKADIPEVLKNLQAGKLVSASCSFISEAYTYKGKEYSKWYFSVDSLKVYEISENKNETSIDIDLPF